MEGGERLGEQSVLIPRDLFRDSFARRWVFDLSIGHRPPIQLTDPTQPPEARSTARKRSGFLSVIAVDVGTHVQDRLPFRWGELDGWRYNERKNIPVADRGFAPVADGATGRSPKATRRAPSEAFSSQIVRHA